MKTKLFFMLCLVALQSFAQHQLPNSLDFLMKERGLSQTLEEDDDLRTLQKRQLSRRFKQAAPEIEWNETKPHVAFEKRSKPHAKTNKQTEIFQSEELVQLFDSIYNWRWDVASTTWANNPDYRYKNFVYNAQNNFLSLISQVRNPNSGLWVNSFKFTNTYDVNNNRLSELFEVWNDNSQTWEIGRKSTWTYNVNKNRLSELYEVWNDISQALENSSKTTWTYNANNNQLSELSENWNTSTQAWVLQNKYTWIYDSNNNQLSVLDETWNINTQAWVNQNKYTWIYDANNNRISELREYWNISSQAWMNLGKTTFTYDVNNNQLSRLNENWNTSTQAWVNLGKTTFTYDVNNNQLSRLNEDWNTSTQTWRKSSKYSLTYDANNFRTSEAFLRFNSNNMVTSGDSTHYYFRTAVGIKEKISHERRINVYPNPASGSVHVAFLASSPEPVALSLRNAVGKVVYTETLPAAIERIKTDIQISDLPPGLYILFAKGKRWMNTEKVMVE